MKRLVLIVLCCGIVAAGVLGLSWRGSLQQVYDGDNVVYSVKQGMTLKGVLNDLEAQNVISSARNVYLYARFSKKTNIRFGHYTFRKGQTAFDVLEILNEGKVDTEQFTIAEGLNRWQIRDLLAKEEWIDAKAFDALCDDSQFLKKHQIPGPSCEGFLFPETYTFARGVGGREIFKTLFKAYRDAFAVATKGGRGPLDLDELKFVTLASIVEKETGAPQERPRIACVFYNRLKAKPVWRMETDPTVIYAATLSDPNFDGNIKRYHLRQMDHPYNTYKRYGLPPGPIASAGRAAFNAVANPSACSDFFFVSMNNGEHVFCPTLDCHNAAVQKWQIEYFRKK